MQLKRSRRPELPTFEELMKGVQEDQETREENPFEVTIESQETMRAFFEDPFEHYSSKSDALDEIKIYDPYYPNFLN